MVVAFYFRLHLAYFPRPVVAIFARPEQFSDGSMIAIDTIVVENEIADNMYQRSELDYLIYNAPLEYADLILNGDPETYLKTVTEYKPWDS